MLQALDTIDTGSNLNDSHVFAWGNDSYSSAKYYKFIFFTVSQEWHSSTYLEIQMSPKAQGIYGIHTLNNLKPALTGFNYQ